MNELDVSRETLIERYFPGKKGEIERFAELLIGEGVERGLIGPREGERIWERHIFNSLPVMELIPLHSSVIDLGSGAGLPGIPLALARPDLRITLIEPLQRRVDFLIEAAANLPITVLRGRGEDFSGKKFKELRSNVVTARAVAPLEKLWRISAPLLLPGGSLLAIKGESAAEEAAHLEFAQLHEISLEGLPLGRVISLKKSA